ncbi:hypothetical protein GCM10010260_48360 [Streptomyces filipinensis]|uniref:Uncharacterized protein n=1 Tax=Streptomyces filipinensis TaxID=66887 RepID=A0A918IDN6_9ACTN|nr:hypothetical protein [Streptomyces filipinensis]GGV05488.1 hypothetical protein GCM10010260_48360 [Streptomyces filipinensis]
MNEGVAAAGLQELELVRAAAGPAPAATALIRVAARLPADWACTWWLDEDEGRILLRIRPPSASAPDAVRVWLARVLADPALRAWRMSDPAAFPGQ